MDFTFLSPPPATGYKGEHMDVTSRTTTGRLRLTGCLESFSHFHFGQGYNCLELE